MDPSATERPPPRERLLAAADHLFYEHGVSSVGVDRVLRESDVARASLYTTFGSKEELVRAYLRRRSERWQATVAEVLPRRWSNPRDRIVGIFVLLAEWFAAPGYRGCPFINASAETPTSDAVQETRDRHREWVRELFAELGRQAGARDPGALAAQLVLIYDGAMVGAQLDRSAAPGETAQTAARALIEAAGSPAASAGRRRS
jgi:AcrR family transcriptional regulator